VLAGINAAQAVSDLWGEPVLRAVLSGYGEAVMWEPEEVDLTPEPWHAAELPWLEDGEGIAPWDAPSAAGRVETERRKPQ
jgi:hypothetical protein